MLAPCRNGFTPVDDGCGQRVSRNDHRSGTFDAPWEWRAALAAEAAPGDCVVKGNISRSGERIYHMPFHQHYDQTKIDESAGERWFCSEVEALAGGWRRALR